MSDQFELNAEVRKLQDELAKLNESLENTKVEAAKQKQLTESVERKLNAANDRIERENKLNELLGPLGKKDRAVMEELLQTVKTDKLDEGFKKYIPAVLNEDTQTVKTKENRSALKESVKSTQTGDKRATVAQTQEDDETLAEIQALQRAAGIK